MTDATNDPYYVAPVVNVVNVLIVGPAMIFVGLAHPSNVISHLCAYALGVVVTLYYAVLLIRSAINGTFSRQWFQTLISCVHVFAIGPLLTFLGVASAHFPGIFESIPPAAYNVLAILGVLEVVVNVILFARRLLKDFAYKHHPPGPGV